MKRTVSLKPPFLESRQNTFRNSIVVSTTNYFEFLINALCHEQRADFSPPFHLAQLQMLTIKVSVFYCFLASANFVL